MSPASMGLAFRVWANCREHGWHRTFAEVAEDLDVPAARIQRVAQSKGWLKRFRHVRTDADGHGPVATMRFDDELDTICGGPAFELRLLEAS